MEGASFWVRLYLLGRDADWANLTNMTGFDEKDLERTFAENSDFSNMVATVLEGVRIGRDPSVCYSDLSPQCSYKEIAFAQWKDSDFTLNPPLLMR